MSSNQQRVVKNLSPERRVRPSELKKERRKTRKGSGILPPGGRKVVSDSGERVHFTLLSRTELVVNLKIHCPVLMRPRWMSDVTLSESGSIIKCKIEGAL